MISLVSANRSVARVGGREDEGELGCGRVAGEAGGAQDRA